MQLFENSNMVGIGVVIGDYNGNIFGALGQKIALPQSIEHVEAHVASRAMVFARELSLFKLASVWIARLRFQQLRFGFFFFFFFHAFWQNAVTVHVLFNKQ